MIRSIFMSRPSAIRRAMIRPWLGWLAAVFVGVLPVRSAQVVFHEIMYHPPGRLPAWIEVRNLTATPLDMADWRLTGLAMEYAFPAFFSEAPGAAILRPFECLILAESAPGEFRQAWPQVGTARVFGPWRGRLKRSGDVLTLRDKNGVPLSRVEFKDDSPWPLAADGAGHSLMLVDSDGVVDDPDNWTASPDPFGTPGRTALTAAASGRPAARLRLSEVHFASDGSVDWVEIRNAGGPSGAVPGELFLASRRDFSDRIAVAPMPESGAVGSVDVHFPADKGADGMAVFLLDGSSRVLDARRFARIPPGESWQVQPPEPGEWYRGSTPSRDRPNPTRPRSAIVINEVMYDPPSNQPDGEFIELYHRGAEPVDLTGWRLREGVEFRFPAGTRLDPGGYLVVAQDQEHLRRVHGDLPLIGNWRKKLGNRGDRIRLVDALGNLVDEVTYRAGGEWPSLARGGGSSLERIHPDVDGRSASAWAESDEAAKSRFEIFRHLAPYHEFFPAGCRTDFRELHLHGVGTGHLELRGMALHDVATGRDLMVHGTAESRDGSGSTGWLFQGNHAGSFVENGRLHLVSTGHGDNRANRAEIDVPELEPGSLCELSFEARWISGSPRLIAQTWDHSFGCSVLLPVPENLGTPGRPNSRRLPAAPPLVDEIQHSPVVPKGDGPVRITVRVTAPVPPARVILYHRLDTREGDRPWAETPMSRAEGSRGEPAVEGMVYAAELVGNTDGQVVQFFVRAEGESGIGTETPRGGRERPALFVVDGRSIPSGIRTARFVIPARELATMEPGDGDPERERQPRFSNRYLHATFISNEGAVYHGARIRRSGSVWNRSDRLARGKWKPPEDRPFRGQRKLIFDDDAEGDRRYSDRLTAYLLHLLGHPVSESEYVRVIVNRGPLLLREEVEPVDADFLRRNFGDGSDGDLYRIDDEWWFDDDWTAYSRDADWAFKGSDEAIRYRTEWMKRSNEKADDFSSLIDFFQRVSTANGGAGDLDGVVDAHAVLKLAAVSGYVANWDTFTQERGKNGYFYRRPGDGRFQMLHWDSDAAFDNGPFLPFYGQRDPFRSWVEQPRNFRLLMGYLAELMERWTENSPRMAAWLEAQNAVHPDLACDIARFQRWFRERREVAYERYGAGFRQPFRISTPAGPAETNADRIEISGEAPFRVIELRIEGQPGLKPRWTTPVRWTFDAVPLEAGPNRIQVIGTDQHGQVLERAEVGIVRRASSPQRPRSGL